MKKHILVFFCFLLYLLTYSQNENNHWILGNTDLNFSSPTVLANSLSSSNYGLSSISDVNGNLLFYTNGVKVWDKNHAVMTNGTNISSNTINVKEVIIVPNPGNSNQYYIFRAEVYPNLCGNNCPNPIYYLYSIVEFNVANPLGVVLNINSAPAMDTPENNFSKALKYNSSNIISNQYEFAPLTYTKDSTSGFYWVIVQNGSSILSYKVDSSGFNSIPVTSNFQSSQIYDYGFYNSSFGLVNGFEGAKFKIAQNNNFLIGLKYSYISSLDNDSDSDQAQFKNQFYKLDFNSSTGVFSNYQALTGTGKMIYEYEISNNSNNLFFIRQKHPYDGIVNNGEIVVKDLTNNSTAVRVINEFVSTTVPSAKFSYLQKDKYGNLLVSSVFTENSRNKYIHSIQNQDSFSNSSVKINDIYLNNFSISRFPQLVPVLNSCYSNITVNTNVNIGVIDKKQASNTIIATNVVDNGATAIYHAGDSVTLSNGFNAVSGSISKIYVEGCTNQYNTNKFGDDNELKENLETDFIQVKLYPNPNNGNFKLSLIGLGGINEITVYDYLGKQVYSSQTLTESTDINLPNINSGLYFLKVINSKVTKTIKFIKE